MYGIEMDIEQVVLGQIEGLEQRLADARAMLKAVRESKRDSGDPKMRFFGRRPIDAAREVLKERGRMKQSELIEILIAGGVIYGTDRGPLNISVSFEKNIDNGNLSVDGEYIEIPNKPTRRRLLTQK
jgi:hypothetical protein